MTSSLAFLRQLVGLLEWDCPRPFRAVGRKFWSQRARVRVYSNNNPPRKNRAEVQGLTVQ